MKKRKPDKRIADAREEVEKLKPRLGLQSWTIIVKLFDEDSDDEADADASVDAHDERDQAVIRISRKADKWPRGKMRHVILHELLHVVFRDLDESTSASISAGRHSPDLTRLREQVVERLTCAILGRRPPPW